MSRESLLFEISLDEIVIADVKTLCPAIVLPQEQLPKYHILTDRMRSP
jgi:hypothetical protein